MSPSAWRGRGSEGLGGPTMFLMQQYKWEQLTIAVITVEICFSFKKPTSEAIGLIQILFSHLLSLIHI